MVPVVHEAGLEVRERSILARYREEDTAGHEPTSRPSARPSDRANRLLSATSTSTEMTAKMGPEMIGGDGAAPGARPNARYAISTASPTRPGRIERGEPRPTVPRAIWHQQHDREQQAERGDGEALGPDHEVRQAVAVGAGGFEAPPATVRSDRDRDAGVRRDPQSARPDPEHHEHDREASRTHHSRRRKPSMTASSPDGVFASHHPDEVPDGSGACSIVKSIDVTTLTCGSAPAPTPAGEAGCPASAETARLGGADFERAIVVTGRFPWLLSIGTTLRPVRGERDGTDGTRHGGRMRLRLGKLMDSQPSPLARLGDTSHSIRGRGVRRAHSSSVHVRVAAGGSVHVAAAPWRHP